MMYFWLAIAAGTGALIRRDFTAFFREHINRKHANWATFIINMTGISLIVVFFNIFHLGSFWYEVLAVGGLGGLTTYSTLNSELVGIWSMEEYKRAIVYFLTTYAVGLILVFLVASFFQK